MMVEGISKLFSYVGTFLNDKFNDYGEYYWPDGKYYKVTIFIKGLLEKWKILRLRCLF